jgi:GNAT superfamily N-acetyltransferase
MEFTRLDAQNIETDLFRQYIDIYVQSFPPDERREPEQLKQIIRTKNNFFPYGLEENGEIISLINLWEFQELDATFGEYFATREDLRNRKIGTFILEHALSKLLTTNYLVGEAEPPDTEITKRRLSYYKRFGINDSGFYYIQPPYDKTKSPLELLFIYYSKLGKNMSYAEYKKIRDIIYREVYGFMEPFSKLKKRLT